jgi:hypothetical protein
VEKAHYINNIIDDNGDFIAYDTLVQKYGRYISHYEYLCIKHALPRKWMNLLKQPVKYNVNPEKEDIFLQIGKESIPIKIVSSKKLYWAIHSKQMEAPTCKENWFKKYGIDFTESKWKTIFTLAKSVLCDTKLIEFQYKIIHKTYASNSYVSNFDNTVDKTCLQCKVEDNTVHFFVDCNKVKLFWEHFKDFISRSQGNPCSLTTCEIIFGKFGISNLSVNFFILYAKWYIHLNKSQHLISFDAFKEYMKNVFIIEKQVYINKGREASFCKQYEPFTKLLM